MEGPASHPTTHRVEALPPRLLPTKPSPRDFEPVDGRRRGPPSRGGRADAVAGVCRETDKRPGHLGRACPPRTRRRPHALHRTNGGRGGKREKEKGGLRGPPSFSPYPPDRRGCVEQRKGRTATKRSTDRGSPSNDPHPIRKKSSAFFFAGRNPPSLLRRREGRGKEGEKKSGFVPVRAA